MTDFPTLRKVAGTIKMLASKLPDYNRMKGSNLLN